MCVSTRSMYILTQILTGEFLSELYCTYTHIHIRTDIRIYINIYIVHLHILYIQTYMEIYMHTYVHLHNTIQYMCIQVQCAHSKTDRLHWCSHRLAEPWERMTAHQPE